MKKYLKIVLFITALALGSILIYQNFLSNKGRKSKFPNMELVEIDPPYKFKSDTAEKLNEVAFNLKNDGHVTQAIKLYLQAIEFEHDNPKLFFDLSECYALANHFRLAISSIDSAINLDPLYPPFYNNRGLCYYQLYKEDSATADFEKAVSLDNKNYVFYANLAMSYYSSHNLLQACDAFKQAKLLGLKIEALPNQKELNVLEGLCK
ncbi:MAG: tetratricopeptide repeat protein [Flavisolibacter sp.]